MTTADALHAQHDHGVYLHERGDDCLAVVKSNYPGLHEKVRRMPWVRHPPESLRTISPPTPGPPSRVLEAGGGRRQLTIERIYLVTSLPPSAATGSELAAWIREHWRIENQLHHVRTALSMRTPRRSAPGTWHLPRLMVGLRNLVISVHRQTATPTSPLPSAAPAATTGDLSRPSD